MNKKNWIRVIVFILAAAVIAFFIAKKHNTDTESSEINEVTDSITQYAETGEEIFCNFLSTDDWPKEQFFSDMVEIYNASTLLNGIKTIIDEWMRFESTERATELLQHADVNKLASEDLKEMFSKYIEQSKLICAQNLSDLDSLSYRQLGIYENALDSTLATRFNINNFAPFPLTNEHYYAAMSVNKEKTALLKGTRCKEITEDNINSKDAQKDIKKIIKRIKKEKDFNTKCAYTMAYIHHVGFYSTEFDLIDELLNDGRYSKHLFFLWRIWRCGVQLCDGQYGPSTWSAIPNKLYNDRRHKIATATLRYIVDHRNDVIAINQFLMTAAQTNILRFGQFPMGNESFTEVYYLGLAPLYENKDSEE